MQIKVKINRHQPHNNTIQLDVIFYKKDKKIRTIYMDSTTEKSNILKHFKLGLFLTLLEQSDLCSLNWDDIDEWVQEPYTSF